LSDNIILNIVAVVVVVELHPFRWCRGRREEEEKVKREEGEKVKRDKKKKMKKVKEIY